MAKKFCPAEDDQIREGYAQGIGATKIGRLIGRPVQSVIWRAQALKVWTPPADEDGWRHAGILTLRRLWTAKDSDGRDAYTLGRIANNTKRSTDAVLAKAAKLGLPPRDAAPVKTSEFPGWYEPWAKYANAAPERAAESARPLYQGHPIAIEALDRVFDQRRFAE